MEGLIGFLAIIVGAAIFLSPLVAFVALRRTTEIRTEISEAQKKQQALSEQVNRLQARLTAVLNDLEAPKAKAGPEDAEAEEEAKVPLPMLPATSVIDYEHPPQQSETVEGSTDEAQDVENDERSEESAAEEKPLGELAVAAAKIEAPLETIAKSDIEPPVDALSEREEVSDGQVEDIGADPEREEPSDERLVPPAALAARVSSEPSRDLERRLNTNWLVWIGGVSLAIAGIFLVRYIAEQGWLSPAMRCAIGVVFGLVLIIAGEVVRRRPLERAIATVNPDYVPQALTAAGLVSAFGSVYLAYAFYELIPSGRSFVLLAGITLTAFALSIVQGKFVALLGLAGAIATPALVSTQDPAAWGFFTYLGTVILATLAVADRQRWYWLPELSLIATAGWTALWLQQPMREADILPIGVTLGIVSLAGFALAWRAKPRPIPPEDSKSFGLTVGADEVAGTGFVLALGSVYTLAVMSDFLPTVHWLLLAFAVGAAMVVRLLPRFDWMLPCMALLSLAVFGLVYVDEDALANLSERLLGTPAPTDYFAEKYEKYLLHGTLIAIALFVGGLQSLGRAKQAQAVALTTGATPLALLVVGYAQFRNFSGDAVWVWAASASVAATVVATIFVRGRKNVASTVPDLYAALAVIAAVLALTFQFDRIWLTLSYAALVLVLAILSMRSDFATVRKLVNLIVLLVLARLTINPDLRGYEILHPLGMQWVSYGYLVPLALVLVASRIFKRTKDDLTVTVLEGAALLLGIVFISIEIRIYMTGSIYSGEYRLPEASLQTIAWLTSALVLARRNLRYPRVFSTWGARLLTAAGALQAVALQLVLLNPVFTGEFIDGYGVFNMLILSLAAPAVLLWLIAGSLLPEGNKYGSQVMVLLRGSAGLLAFAFVTEEVRVVFQGMLIRPEHASLLELYITTLAWLIPAAVPYVLNSDRTSDHLRLLASIVTLVAGLMLVLGHAYIYNPVFSGELVRGWPAINTLLLGFLLPATVLYLVARKTEGIMRGALLAGTYLLVLVWVWLSFKHGFQGSRLALRHESLLELYLTTLAWLLLGSAPFFVSRIGKMAEAKRAGYAILTVSSAMLFVGHTLIFNPAVDTSFVPGWPVFNVLLLGFIVPAVILGLVANKLDQALLLIIQAAAYVLLFVGITMMVKHAFQGAVLTLETLTDIEDYGYSAAWLALALATMITGIVKDNSNVRYASLGVLLLVVIKVFLRDMSGLAGLWRVASFFGLGISLVGIGFVYQQFMYRKQTSGVAPPTGPQEA